jgi:hypothetical protein
MERSKNSIDINGTLAEVNLERVKATTKFANGEDYTGECIRTKDYMNPSFTVNVNGHDVGVYCYPTYDKYYNKKDDAVEDNDRFNTMVELLESYVPMSKDKDSATRIHVRGSIVPNEYASSDGDWKEYTPRVNAFTISTNASDEDSAEGYVTGYIKSISDEITVPANAGNPVATGRTEVKFYVVDSRENIFPITFYVEEDMSDDFKGMYENGQSTKLDFEVSSRHVGGKPKKAAFGRSAKTTTGYNVTEYIIIGAYDPFEEDDDAEEDFNGNKHNYYISPKEFKEKLDERDVMIKQKMKEASEGGGKSSKKLGKKIEKKDDFIPAPTDGEDSDSSCPF